VAGRGREPFLRAVLRSARSVDDVSEEGAAPARVSARIQPALQLLQELLESRASHALAVRGLVNDAVDANARERLEVEQARAQSCGVLRLVVTALVSRRRRRWSRRSYAAAGAANCA
jgi:hypothetical protein